MNLYSKTFSFESYGNYLALKRNFQTRTLVVSPFSKARKVSVFALSSEGAGQFGDDPTQFNGQLDQCPEWQEIYGEMALEAEESLAYNERKPGEIQKGIWMEEKAASEYGVDPSFFQIPDQGNRGFAETWPSMGNPPPTAPLSAPPLDANNPNPNLDFPLSFEDRQEATFRQILDMMNFLFSPNMVTYSKM